MAFEVIPAIDVAGGRLARLSAEGTVPVEAYGGDPVAAARACLEAGARLLHVVDLDLAFTGEPRNADVLRAIVALGARVQAAGAIVERPPDRRRPRGGRATGRPRFGGARRPGPRPDG